MVSTHEWVRSENYFQSRFVTYPIKVGNNSFNTWPCLMRDHILHKWTTIVGDNDILTSFGKSRTWFSSWPIMVPTHGSSNDYTFSESIIFWWTLETRTIFDNVTKHEVEYHFLHMINNGQGKWFFLVQSCHSYHTFHCRELVSNHDLECSQTLLNIIIQNAETTEWIIIIYSKEAPDSYNE